MLFGLATLNRAVEETVDAALNCRQLLQLTTTAYFNRNHPYYSRCQHDTPPALHVLLIPGNETRCDENKSGGLCEFDMRDTDRLKVDVRKANEWKANEGKETNAEEWNANEGKELKLNEWSPKKWDSRRYGFVTART